MLEAMCPLLARRREGQLVEHFIARCNSELAAELQGREARGEFQVRSLSVFLVPPH